MVDAQSRYKRALRDTSPTERILTALEIRHQAVATHVRVVNDTQSHVIDGETYSALRFSARLADDVEGRPPSAEIIIDNVGRELTQWIELASGGVGAQVRIMRFVEGESAPQWEAIMDVAGMSFDQSQVVARLGFNPLLGRAAVLLRHDPETTPGAF